MKRVVLIIALAALLHPLMLASGASAMRVTGSTLGPDPAQASRSKALVEFGNYVVAAPLRGVPDHRVGHAADRRLIAISHVSPVADKDRFCPGHGTPVKEG